MHTPIWYIFFQRVTHTQTCMHTHTHSHTHTHTHTHTPDMFLGLLVDTAATCLVSSQLIILIVPQR